MNGAQTRVSAIVAALGISLMAPRLRSAVRRVRARCRRAKPSAPGGAGRAGRLPPAPLPADFSLAAKQSRRRAPAALPAESAAKPFALAQTIQVEPLPPPPGEPPKAGEVPPLPPEQSPRGLANGPLLIARRRRRRAEGVRNDQSPGEREYPGFAGRRRPRDARPSAI